MFRAIDEFLALAYYVKEVADRSCQTLQYRRSQQTGHTHGDSDICAVHCLDVR